MNKLLIALTLIAAFFTSNAIAEKINYYGHEYSGDLKDGVPHGEGEIKNKNGSTFSPFKLHLIQFTILNERG